MNLFIWYWLFAVVIAVLYTALMVWFMVGWNNLKYYVPNKKTFNTKVTVIVPFHNEADVIEKCLLGLLSQQIQTNEYTVIAVNDNSTDESVAIVEKLEKDYNRLSLLHNTEKGKKSALSYAVNSAPGELIITTDADCIYQPNWLTSMVSYYEEYKPGMIIGPVSLEIGKGFFQRFQLLEFNSLIMATGGAAGIGHPIMCNGANLAFKKEIFQSLNNPMNDEYVSGDDIFLMHSFKRETDEEIHFLKSHEAMVRTQAKEGIKQFFLQRERWASKAKGYTDADTIFTASIVFGVAGLILIGLAFMPFNWHFIKPIMFLFVVKLVVDFLFFNTSDSFFKHRMLFLNFILFQLFYIIYILVASFRGLLKAERWKKEKALIN